MRTSSVYFTRINKDMFLVENCIPGATVKEQVMSEDAAVRELSNFLYDSRYAINTETAISCLKYDESMRYDADTDLLWTDNNYGRFLIDTNDTWAFMSSKSMEWITIYSTEDEYRIDYINASIAKMTEDGTDLFDRIRQIRETLYAIEHTRLDLGLSAHEDNDYIRALKATIEPYKHDFRYRVIDPTTGIAIYETDSFKHAYDFVMRNRMSWEDIEINKNKVLAAIA